MFFSVTNRRHGARSGVPALLCGALLGAVSVSAQNMEVDLDDQNSMANAAAAIAYNMMTYYIGNETGQAPGMFPGSGTPTGYYWWEGSEAFAGLIDYWYYFGNEGYVQSTSEAMLWQAGSDGSFQPQNQTLSLGNDDQAYWGFAAMTAAETHFPNPPKDKKQWVALAQSVYNTQVPRFDTSTCGGGLRWQAVQFNAGYHYKSSIANGGLMNLAARLALYTGDQGYFDWAEKLYDWVVDHNLIDDQGNVFDGTDVDNGCSDVNRLQYSSNAGVFCQNTAAMYNATKLWGKGNPSKWQSENTKLVQGTLKFFWNGAAPVEKMCETIGTCNNDMKSFKSDLMYELAWSAKMAPFMLPQIAPKLRSATEAAMSVCNCGAPGQCGFKWTSQGTCDGVYGLGQQINALRALQTQMDKFQAGPVNKKTGDSSISQPDGDAGSGSMDPNEIHYPPATTGQKAGAGVLTALVVIGILGGAVWLVL